MPKITRAILSCHDKTGLTGFAAFLHEQGVELVSTSGTLKVLREAGIPAIGMAEFTGMPELMNGRVKTLHPRVHAGLLGVRDNKLHEEQLQAHELKWVDLVAVNLQPFERMLESAVTPDEVFEQIDIGGTAMLRSAAKNFRYVTVVTDPRRYDQIIHDMRAHEGAVSYRMRAELAQAAFACCASYDQKVAAYMRETLSAPE